MFDVSVAPSMGAEVLAVSPFCCITPSFPVGLNFLLSASLSLRKPPRRPSRPGKREGHIIETTCVT